MGIIRWDLWCPPAGTFSNLTGGPGETLWQQRNTVKELSSPSYPHFIMLLLTKSLHRCCKLSTWNVLGAVTLPTHAALRLPFVFAISAAVLGDFYHAEFRTNSKTDNKGLCKNVQTGSPSSEVICTLLFTYQYESVDKLLDIWGETVEILKFLNQQACKVYGQPQKHSFWNS